MCMLQWLEKLGHELQQATIPVIENLDKLFHLQILSMDITTYLH